jgi:hypothetical protein
MLYYGDNLHGRGRDAGLLPGMRVGRGPLYTYTDAATDLRSWNHGIQYG